MTQSDKRIQQIRNEFGEPFRDAVIGLAVQGWSRRAAADILQIHQATFLRYVRRFNVGQYFKPVREMRRECRSYGTKPETWRNAE